MTFENAEMRYQENLPLVLKKVSFTIKPKEKIGIVGRTGSGKDPVGVKFVAHVYCLLTITRIPSDQVPSTCVISVSGLTETTSLVLFSTLLF